MSSSSVSVQSRLEGGDEVGFGLVEIVVSMLILGLIAIAFLPLLIQGVRVAADNRFLATATQLLQDQLEQARTKESCAAIAGLDGADLATVNPDFTMNRAVTDAENPADADPCPASYPGVIGLWVGVYDANTSELLVEASTLVLVTEP